MIVRSKANKTLAAAKEICILVCGTLLLVYFSWVLYEDLRSYAYRPAPATSHSLIILPGSGRRGSEVELSYTFTDAAGRKQHGERLFSGLAESVHPVAERTLNRWHDGWKQHPIVYYDPSDPTTSRAVIGLTASYSAVVFPVLLIGGSWVVFRRRENRTFASGPPRRYSSVAVVGGVAGTLFASACAQLLYFTPLWVEYGWITHATIALGAAGGMFFSVRRSKQKTQRWLDELKSECEQNNTESRKNTARVGLLSKS